MELGVMRRGCAAGYRLVFLCGALLGFRDERADAGDWRRPPHPGRDVGMAAS